MENNESVLQVKNASISFGGLKAVDDFNIDIKKGELVGLIGPNGAGKTTIFNLITGVYFADKGEIILCGKDISKMKTHNRIKEGIARTFQNIRLFKKMTVLDNVKVAYNIHMNYSILSGIFRTKKYKLQEQTAEDKAMELLKLFDLDTYASELAQNLPYGKQRKLEIVRALMTDCKLLCLDEPAAGMNPAETEELMSLIKFIREKIGVTILLIEHDMKLVMGICDRITVLNFGQVIAVGTPKEITSNEEVIAAYLGE